jgi:hypothetical protein
MPIPEVVFVPDGDKTRARIGAGKGRVLIEPRIVDSLNIERRRCDNKLGEEILESGITGRSAGGVEQDH